MKNKIFTTLVLIALFIASCKKEKTEPNNTNNNNNQNSNSCNVVTLDINATITTPTTWTKGNVYVIPHRVDITSTLTIEAGTIIKLKNSGAYINVNGAGIIKAIGNKDNRIIFTSLADDSHCGDNNGDGAATLPQKGDWESLNLNGAAKSEFTYCDFKYAGKRIYQCINGSAESFVFDNCIIAHTLSGNNTESVAFGMSLKNSNQIITNCAFYDNDIPIEIYAQYQLSNTNIFHNPKDTTVKNKRNGIWVTGATNTLEGNTILWNITEVPYVLNNYYYISSPSVLSIADNVVLKFVKTSDGLSRAAQPDLLMSNSAIFTTYKDDTVGGDTNGDGNITSPAAASWKGIRNAWIGSTLAGAWESGSNIRYSEK